MRVSVARRPVEDGRVRCPETNGEVALATCYTCPKFLGIDKREGGAGSVECRARTTSGWAELERLGFYGWGL